VTIKSQLRRFIIQKTGCPSGTAITLADEIVNHHSGYKKWCYADDKTDMCIPIHSIREGDVPEPIRLPGIQKLIQ